jgi:isoamylase
VTADPVVRALRDRQRKNFLITLLASVGVPMLSGGDEMLRTQLGNNNAYCHDSILSWTHWTLDAEAQAMLEFTQRVVALRASHPVLRRRTFLNGRQPDAADVLWLRPDGHDMTAGDWQDGSRRELGVLLDGDNIGERDARGEPVRGDTVMILLNASATAVPFVLPRRTSGAWECQIDSVGRCPAPPVAPGSTWILESHSSAVFRYVPATP